MIFRLRADAPRPELRHINNTPQITLLIVGLISLLVFGLGIFVLIAWSIYFEYYPTYKIKNDDTNETMYMPRKTWKKLRN